MGWAVRGYDAEGEINPPAYFHSITWTPHPMERVAGSTPWGGLLGLRHGRGAPAGHAKSRLCRKADAGRTGGVRDWPTVSIGVEYLTQHHRQPSSTRCRCRCSSRAGACATAVRNPPTADNGGGQRSPAAVNTGAWNGCSAATDAFAAIAGPSAGGNSKYWPIPVSGRAP
jgi:hypothetical protein